MTDRSRVRAGDVGFEGYEPRRACSDTFDEVLARRLHRRSLLKGGALAPLFSIGSISNLKGAEGDSGLRFAAIQGSAADEIGVPEGYKWEALAAWGQPLTNSAPEFDPDNLDPEAQRQQVGYNCDFLAWFDYIHGSGIVGVNHEYTSPQLMFRNYSAERTTQREVDYEIASHGVSFFLAVPYRRDDGPGYRHYRGSAFNRRIHGETPIAISGPAAGHPLLVTSSDQSGTEVRGTFNNCGGGITPWGTYLTAEENFDQYFGNNRGVTHEMAKAANDRFGVRDEGGRRQWWRFQQRFDLDYEPNEANKFGWVVEIDPYNPNLMARKRTALGRFKHEAAATTLSGANRAVVYSGDDARFEYVYKFVSDGTYDASSRSANRDLLDSGTLYVAKFNDDGSGEWLPLTYENGPINASSGFTSQAEVLLFARQAADLLGATQMDRPEDIEVNPLTKKVYVALTNNTRRAAGDENAPNPRAPNPMGHIVEISERGGDSGATRFDWEIFMLCGDPASEADGTFFAGFAQERVSKIANPDNLAFDKQGNMLIATDGQPRTLGINDGIFFVPTEGSERGYNRQIFSGVVGAECASVIMNSAQDLMMVSIQHPGEGGTRQQRTSSFGGPAVNRPTVVAVTRTEQPYRIGS
jgi:secreted PhoX family phosphatase